MSQENTYNENDYVIKELQKRLEEMQAMTPLPNPASKEAEAMGHDNWMKQNDAIVQFESLAMVVASLALPPDVYQLLKKIQERKSVLLGLREEEK